MRSRAPGPKFSTRTSLSLISFSRMALPSGFLVSRDRPRLLLLSMVKYNASTSGMSRSWLRVTSPAPGRSTLITSAPNQASSWVQAGPACTWVKSMILMPLSGLFDIFISPCEMLLVIYFFFAALVGFRLVMRPLSVPAPSSMTALIRVGLRDLMASSIALRSSSGVVTCTPTPPKACISMS